MLKRKLKIFVKNMKHVEANCCFLVLGCWSECWSGLPLGAVKPLGCAIWLLKNDIWIAFEGFQQETFRNCFGCVNVWCCRSVWEGTRAENCHFDYCRYHFHYFHCHGFFARDMCRASGRAYWLCCLIVPLLSDSEKGQGSCAEQVAERIDCVVCLFLCWAIQRKGKDHVLSRLKNLTNNTNNNNNNPKHCLCLPCVSGSINLTLGA